MKLSLALLLFPSILAIQGSAHQDSLRGSIADNSRRLGVRKDRDSDSKSKLKKQPESKNKKLVEEVNRRAVVQARITIPGVNTDDLTAGEAMLLERCMLSAFADVHEGVDDTNLQNMIVVSPSDEERRRLMKKAPIPEDQQGRSLYWWYTWSYNGYGSTLDKVGYYDAWAYMDVTCSFCGYEDDDDDGNWRHLKEAVDIEMHQTLETTVCDCLASGPFETFNDAQDCQITYFGA